MKYFKPVNWQKTDETQHTQADNKLRQKLINNFVKDNSNKYSEIADAVNAGDLKLAHRLAHTLKGNAGHLGKTFLQQAAAEVELLLKDGQNQVTPEQMAALETELNKALADLTPLVTEVPRPETRAEPVGSAQELIEKLIPMLELGDLEARKYIDELKSIPGSEALINRLIQQIEDLDFDLALTTIAELNNSLDMKQVHKG